MLKINMLSPEMVVSIRKDAKRVYDLKRYDTRRKRKTTLEKLCARCSTLKLHTEYSKSSGRCVAYCKPCMAEYYRLRNFQNGKTSYLKPERKVYTKICTMCHIEKPKSAFSKKGTNSFASWCKPCKNAYSNKKERESGWASSAKWRAANIEKRRVTVRNWDKNNKDKRRVHRHTRKARLRGAQGSFTPAEWQQLKQLYKFQCLSCLKYEPEILLTPDHVVPISKGGCGDIGNIQPLCSRCNSVKNTKTVDYRESENDSSDA